MLTIIPQIYQRLIDLGIDKTANLPDLNDMTDRGNYPLKPFTAKKTIGTIRLINDFNITDEVTLVDHFQKKSKKDLVELSNEVYEHQLKYFKRYKHSKETVFKYVYCCIVVNSLRGNSSERRFESWARSAGMIVKNAPPILDEKYHTDRIGYDRNNKIESFISVKPNSFSSGYMRYKDVFGGLQFLSDVTGIPWKIFYQEGINFVLIDYASLSPENQKEIKTLSESYRNSEVQTQIIDLVSKL